MINLRKIISTALCASVIFLSPGLSCYEALAIQGEKSVESIQTLNIGNGQIIDSKFLSLPNLGQGSAQDLAEGLDLKVNEELAPALAPTVAAMADAERQALPQAQVAAQAQ